LDLNQSLVTMTLANPIWATKETFFSKKSDNEISLKAKFFTDYYLTITLCFYTQMKTITTCFSYFTVKTKILSSCLCQRMHLLQFSQKHPEKICFSKTFFDFGCLKIITTKVSITKQILKFKIKLFFILI
jgi:hypothetical protein